MTQTYDVIIIGAGIVGSMTARPVIRQNISPFKATAILDAILIGIMPLIKERNK